MKLRKLRFISGNPHKMEEATNILHPYSIDVIPINIKLNELQTTDLHKLVREKVLEAFDKIGRPLFVEHTSIFLDILNGFPGGLGQIFWDTLEADRFTDLFGKAGMNNIEARTIIGYCDGCLLHFFEGTIKGTVAEKPRGPRDFQWDCIFIPEGYAETFAEMGQKKNTISMRKLALDKFAKYLSSR